MPSKTEYTGRAGTAALVNRQVHDLPATNLASWMVKVPGLMPPGLWDTWLISVISLADIAGEEPATRAFPDLDYELAVTALDPQGNPRPDQPGDIIVLDPANIIYQFGGVDDAAAVTLAQMAAFACADGILIVEPSGIMGERERWASTLYDTLEHVRSKHAPGGSGARDATLLPDGWVPVSEDRRPL